MAKKIFFVFSLVLLLLGGWWLGQRKNEPAKLRSLPDHSIIDWQLAGKSLQAEVVNTPFSITNGLSGRARLENIDGMLFVFDQPAIRTFWMKDMLFAIDIIWINDDHVVGVERDVQPPELGTPESQVERRTSPEPVDTVLETLPGRLTWD